MSPTQLFYQKNGMNSQFINDGPLSYNYVINVVF
jgi:hypothetical protein